MGLIELSFFVSFFVLSKDNFGFLTMSFFRVKRFRPCMKSRDSMRSIQNRERLCGMSLDYFFYPKFFFI